MIFRIPNRILTEGRERTALTKEISAGATVLTVKGVDANEWSNNDWLILGEIGTSKAEIMQVNGDPSDGVTLTVDEGGSGGTRYAHSSDEPVYKIAYNEARLFHASTENGDKTTLATIAIQPSNHETVYEDLTNSTGFGFVAFFNSATSEISPYSDAVPYGGQSDRSLAELIQQVRLHLNEQNDNFLTDQDITASLNIRQAVIVNAKMWTFNEGERSASLVANKLDYDKPNDFKTIHTCRIDSEPLESISRTQWEDYHYDLDATTDTPWLLSIFADKVRLYPRPTEDSATTTLTESISDSATTIPVAKGNFERADYYRFSINGEVIYADSMELTDTGANYLGCSRGQEGTTPIHHTHEDIVTERNVVYSGQLKPVNLKELNDETVIPEPYVLSYGAASDLAFGKLNDQKRGTFCESKYQELKEDLDNKFTMKYLSLIHISEPTRPY